jgi:hypothetical protein
MALGMPTDDPSKVTYKDRDPEGAAHTRRQEYLNLMRSMLDPLKDGAASDLSKDEFKWKPRNVYRAYPPDADGKVEVLFIAADGEFLTAVFGGPNHKKFLYVEAGW